MPRKGAKIAGVAPLPGDEFLRVSESPLTLDERQALRAIFQSPLWQKVWRNALSGKPVAYVHPNNPQFTGILANNQFHVMQGWELFRKALESQIADKIPKPSPPKEDYSKPLEIVTPEPKTP